MRPKVVAIILNYNKAIDTIQCIESLQQCLYKKLEILVVDNGSTDDSAEKIRSAVSEVEILETGTNLGFAAGNNFGIRHILPKVPGYILLINNDTLVEPGFLDPLVEVLENDKNLAAAGGTICYYPDTDRVWYAGGEFRPFRASSFATHIGASFADIPLVDPQHVTFITGCMMLLRPDPLKKVGLFDERFFMYFEDADLSLRLISAGYGLVYVSESRIYHRIQPSNHTAFVLYYHTRNRLLFVDSATKGWIKLLAKFYFFTVMFAKMVIWRVRRPDLFRAAVMGIRDFGDHVYYEGRGLSLANPFSGTR